MSVLSVGINEGQSKTHLKVMRFILSHTNMSVRWVQIAKGSNELDLILRGVVHTYSRLWAPTEDRLALNLTFSEPVSRQPIVFKLPQTGKSSFEPMLKIINLFQLNFWLVLVLTALALLVAILLSEKITGRLDVLIYSLKNAVL